MILEIASTGVTIIVLRKMMRTCMVPRLGVLVALEATINEIQQALRQSRAMIAIFVAGATPVPTTSPSPAPTTPVPTPAPTVVRKPDHEFDFRGSSSSSDTTPPVSAAHAVVATTTEEAQRASKTSRADVAHGRHHPQRDDLRGEPQ